MAVPVQSDGLNSSLSPVVYGYIAPSIDTQYNTMICICEDGGKQSILGGQHSAHQAINN